MTQTIEEEITELTERWYRYVNFDHHKDRDCHWYITKQWSYGDKPFYVATHSGYRAERWQSPKCANAHAAQVCLRDFLLGEIASAVNYTESAIEGYSDEEMQWNSLEQLQNELDALTGAYKKEGDK